VSLYAAALAPGEKVAYAPAGGRHAWLQVARGVTLNDTRLGEGEVFLFDLA
jgi:Quercetinase C-terminal cupin domain